MLLILVCQSGIQALHVVGCERAVGLAQFQRTQQDIVTSFGQPGFGVKQDALRIEHVDVDAHTHLVTEPGGIKCALAGGFGRFQYLLRHLHPGHG